MVDIVARLQCTRPHVTATTVRQLSRIIVALVAMTGRVTMVGMARWAGKGGSYRTIQRFFATVIPWGILFWASIIASATWPRWQPQAMIGSTSLRVASRALPRHP
jgi:IS4 transposase